MKNKAIFLKEAKLKYINHIKDLWLSEMNFIFSDELILRVWFEHEEVLEGEVKFKWCSVSTLTSQADKKIENELGRFVSNESKDFPAIIKALRESLVDNQEELIDYIKFADGEDDDIGTTITPIQTLESTYSVKSFCDLIGIG